MKIAHIVAGVEEEASGPSYAVPRLVEAQVALGHDAQLHTLAAPHDAPPWVVTHTRTRHLPVSLGASQDLHRACDQMNDSFDIVHVHGLWMMPNVYPFLPRTPGARRILSPRGTLMPRALDHHAWRKRTFWLAGQRRAMRADAVHATSAAEAEAVRDRGFSGPVLTAPNGIDIPVGSGPADETRQRSVLYVGRIHPIKGLDMLLQAWSTIEPDRPDWDLRIVGPSTMGTVQDLKQLARQLRLERVHFSGPLYGADKVAAFARANVYVLPTHTENFGMTVLEALAHGTPVITTHGAPWQGLEDHDCGWWVDASAPGIQHALRQATGMERSDLEEMGHRGRQWAQTAFSWRSIAERMTSFYESLLQG